MLATRHLVRNWDVVVSNGTLTLQNLWNLIIKPIDSTFAVQTICLELKMTFAVLVQICSESFQLHLFSSAGIKMFQESIHLWWTQTIPCWAIFDIFWDWQLPNFLICTLAGRLNVQKKILQTEWVNPVLESPFEFQIDLVVQRFIWIAWATCDQVSLWFKTTQILSTVTLAPCWARCGHELLAVEHVLDFLIWFCFTVVRSELNVWCTWMSLTMYKQKIVSSRPFCSSYLIAVITEDYSHHIP